ncbi:MAG: hypothetical protein ISR87_02835 [Candidatus Marinimicrobia bacterium]|nr:hypothetical protein [FCB group bacterium]MBL7024365.1 hypothetical protein [Candidatus Neomarinimicrobiota bacterium]
MRMKLLFVLVLIPIVFLFTYCEEDDPEEVLEPPVVTSLSTPSAYSGEPVVITGSDFNPTLNMNLVELAGITTAVTESATPSAGTETTLTFTVPTMSLSGETIDAYVSVRNLGSDLASDSLELSVKPIFNVDSVPDLPKTKGGIAFDGEGKLYVRGQDPGDIYLIGPNGNQRYFGNTVWGEGEMIVGPDGYLYAAVVWGTYGVMRLPLATGGDGVTYVPDTDIDNPFCLDFDEDENLYVGTADGGFWRRNSDGTVTQILSDRGWGSPTRLNGDYVYWYTKSDSGSNGLFRAPLPDASTQDTIATSSIETILQTEDYTPSGLAVDSFGNVYLMDGWGGTMLVRITPSGVVEELIELPTENPNKATFYGDVLVITQGNQGNEVWYYYLGEGYGDTATPRYMW